MATRTILLDVGGTFIKCSDGRQIPINSDGTREEIEASLTSAVGDACEVAVAIPGPFDYNHGIFLMKHKFTSVYGMKFEDLCGGKGKTFHFIHDVNVMLLGEMTSGEGKGFNRTALIALGTGLGFSMSIDGKILENEFGSPAVHIWNTPYQDGILEDYVSKRGFLRGLDGITVKELALKAYEGNAEAISRFNECAAILAQAIRPVLKEYRIECLLFGGQISRSFGLLEPVLSEGLKDLGLKKISRISDIDNATFNGLRSVSSLS